jgi:CBS domain containing-hemolysin-like protein
MIKAMILLILYSAIAVGFSFFCSILEAVLLSVNSPYIALLEKQKKPSGKLLRQLKKQVSQPLAAILTLNTLAHTLGAAGVGAQATVVFGNGYIGIVSAVLTLLILFISEIIPKTLGATYWRQLAPFSAYSLKYLIKFLYPFVKASEFITKRIASEAGHASFNREEIALITELSLKQGKLDEQESQLLKSLLKLTKIQVKDAMTPRVIMFSLSDKTLVETFFHKHDQSPFTRIPIFHKDSEEITGYVVRNDLLLAQARGNGQNNLANYRRDIPVILDSMPLQQALNEILQCRVHMMLVVDEIGSIQGIVTLEDVLETALGLEFVDEKDEAIDMQKEAKRQWKKRKKIKAKK